MKLIYNKFIPFKGFKAINLFGVVFVRKECYMSYYDKNHELIHTKQMQEMLYIPFYIWYFIEWFIKLFIYGKKAYNNISFEREAYNNQQTLIYTVNRKHYSWFKYLFKK